MTSWQPIETAPKDGTRILTFGKGHGNHIGSYDINEPSTPMYSVAYWGWFDGEKDVEVRLGLFRKEPCRYAEGWRTEWSYTPTHWVPLPEPPASADTRRMAETGTGSVRSTGDAVPNRDSGDAQ